MKKWFGVALIMAVVMIVLQIRSQGSSAKVVVAPVPTAAVGVEAKQASVQQPQASEQFLRAEAEKLRELQENPPKIIHHFDENALFESLDEAERYDEFRQHGEREAAVRDLNDGVLPELSEEDKEESARLLESAGFSSRFSL